MPTLKPRVQVTLEPQTHEVFARLAYLQGRTRGSIIAELLDSIAPALTQTIAILEAAQSAPQHVKDGLKAVVETAHDDLVLAAGDGIKQMDFLLSELSGGDANPHVVTRGSGLTDTPPPQSPKTKRKPATTRATAKSTTPNGTGVEDAGKKRQI
jgi:hypothetical protein